MAELSIATSGTDVVPGDPDALEELAARLHSFATGMADAAGVLGGIETETWSGPGADAFRSVMGEQSGRYGTAAQAFGIAAFALSRYAMELRSAQEQAQAAVGQFAAAERKSAPWRRWRAAEPMRAQDSQLPPVLRRPATDPGEPERTGAAGLAEQAVQDASAAARELVGILERARKAAPRRPSVLDRFADGLAHRIETAPGGGIRDGIENVLIGAGKAGRDMGVGLWTMTGGAITDPGRTGAAWLALARLASGDPDVRTAFVLDFLDLQDWRDDPEQAAGYVAANLGALLVAPGRLGATRIRPVDWQTLTDAVRGANPRYHPADPAYCQNCVHAAMALPLRMAGREAEARPLPARLQHRRPGDGRPGGRGPTALTRPWHANAIPGGPARIERALEKAGPGARAAVLVQWIDGSGGHAFNAVNIDGKVHFVDAQTSSLDARSHFLWADPRLTAYVPLTGEPSLRIMRYVKGAELQPDRVRTVTRSGLLAIYEPEPSAR